jgi:hypothetical protein
MVVWMEDPVNSYCHRYTKNNNCRTRHWWKTKRKKSAKWISTVQCTQEPRGMTLRNHTNSVPWMLAVTSTPYHEWPRSHQLRTMNERGHNNSVQWMNAVTPTPYHECTQFVDSVKPILFRPIAYIVHSWYGVGVTAFIHGTELMRFGKVALRSTKISIKWLWPVKVTLEVIKRRTIIFCWSWDEGHLKWDKKISESPVYNYGSNKYTLVPPTKWSVNAFNQKQIKM